MQIFLLDGNVQTGPYSAEEFERVLRAGTVAETALYWHEGCTDWLPVTQHPDFPQRLSLTPPPLRPPPRPTAPSLAVRPAGPLKFCTSCGHAVAKSATSCPNCGGRLRMGCLPKLAVGVGALVVAYLALGLLNAVLSKGTPQTRHEKPPGVPPIVADVPLQRSQAAVTPLPGAEAAFIDAVTSYTSRYASTGNELQKSTVRTERRAALAHTVTDLRVSAWVGTLQKLETLPDGRASISVQLESSVISVETGVVNPFDVASNTLIEHGSTLYNKLASLSVGDRVTFSGSFLSGEQDYLKETSFTEAGSMTKPSFAMRFSEVELLSAAPTPMPVVKPTLVARAEASPSETLTPVATATPSLVLPPDEVAFIDAIQSYVSPYSAASNELQKSTARADRARRLARLLSTMQVVRWVGTLREMTTGSDGTAGIAIRLPESAITVKTVWINPFDPSTKTLIDPRSSLYKRLASMSKGSEVTFSGSFLSDDQDYIKETSFTEAGSMTEPEFAMRFADVTALASTNPATSSYSPSRNIAQSDSQNGVSSLPIERTGPPVLPSSSAATASTPPPLSVTPPGVAASTSEGSSTGASGNTPVLEQLLIGKWQGARHLTEYRADYTRVMDGVNLNPPRTWHLDGDQLSEGPGRNVYKVVTLDQNQLVLEGDEGKHYVHQRVQIPVVNRVGIQSVDPVSAARQTVLNFYNWYLERDSRGISPWNDGSLAQRNDVTHLFAVRSQSAHEPEGETDPILAGQHLPNPGSVLDGKVEGLVATVRVRLVTRDVPHDVNVRLVRSTIKAPWQIDDVQPAPNSVFAPSVVGASRTPATALNGTSEPTTSQVETLSNLHPVQTSIEKGPDFVQSNPYTDVTDRFFAAVKAHQYDKAYEELAVEFIQNPATSSQRFKEFIQGDSLLSNIQQGRYLSVENHESITIIKTKISNTQGTSASVDFLLIKSYYEPWKICAIFSDTQFPHFLPGVNAASLGLSPRTVVEDPPPPPPEKLHPTVYLTREQCIRKLISNFRNIPGPQDSITLVRLLEIFGQPRYRTRLSGQEIWQWDTNSGGPFIMNVDVKAGVAHGPFHWTDGSPDGPGSPFRRF